MKVLSRILMGSVALAAAAGAASADELSSLKADIESLQSRVSQLESQTQASVPAGYSLLSIRSGQPYFDYIRAEKSDDVIPENAGFTLSVVPAADVAPAAEVAVSVELRTALVYTDFQTEDNADIVNRVRFIVRGKTETAVGEVGGYFRLKAEGGGDFSDFSEDVEMQRAFGWWKFAPDWQLLAGQEDMTATLQTSWDWLAATGPVRSFGPSDAYNEQMRLSYASGPLSFAISLEDPDNFTEAVVTTIVVPGPPPATVTTLVTTDIADKSDLPNVQAYIMYSGDTFAAQVAGVYQDDDFGADDWAIGGGASIKIGEAFQVFGAAVTGEGTSLYANNLAPIDTDEGFWLGSAGILAQLSEETRIELGVGIEDYDDAGEALGVGGGVYWSPVSLVTLGAGATYVDFTDAFLDGPAGDSTSDNSLQVFVGLWLRGLQYE